MVDNSDNILTRWKRRFYASQFARNLAMLASGTVVGQLVVLLSAPVLARLYTEADFGIFGVYVSVATILNSISALRIDQAIPLPEKDEDAALLLRLSLWITLWFSLGSGLIIILCRSQIAAWKNEPELVSYLWLIPVTLLGYGVYRSLTAWAVREEIYKELAYTRVSRSFGQVLVQVGLGFLMHGSFGLILGNAAGQWVGIGRLLGPVRRASQGLVKQRGDFRRLWARYIKFPLYSSPSALLVTIPRQIPNILFFDYFGAGEAGFLFFASRILRQPAALLSESISQVFLGRAAKLLNENPAKLSGLYFGMVRRMLLISLVPAAILILAGPWLIYWIFGARWEGSVIYVQILSAVLVAEITVSSTSPIMSVLEKQDWQLKGDILRTLLVIASLVVPHLLGWGPHPTIISYAVAMIFCYIVYFGIFSNAVLLKSREVAALGPQD
jgi:O-antigen/teichoic acid export membrane protein